jgi:hypothetical protein
VTNPLATAPVATAALVATNSSTGSRRSLTFQYAPETVRRSIEPNLVGGEPGARSQAVRFAGSAAETLTMDCRFTGLDPVSPSAAGGQSVAPKLAALAVLASPSSADVGRAQAMLDSGLIEVIPALADQLVLVLGATRVTPCQIVSFAIVEEIYDSSLEPVLATVSLTLRLVSTSDVDSSNPSYAAAAAYQNGQERLAAAAFTTITPGTSPW